MEQSKATIKSYFETGDKPTQEQYHDTWDSFWHKDDIIPKESVESQVLGFSTTVELNQSTPISALLDPLKIGIVSDSNVVKQIVFGFDLMSKINPIGSATTKGQLGMVISNVSNGQSYSGKIKYNTGGSSGNNTYAYFDVIENDIPSTGFAADDEVQIVLYYVPQEPQVYGSVLSAVDWSSPIPSSIIGDRFLVLTSGPADISWTLLGDIGDNEIYEVIGHANGAQFYAIPQSKSKLGQKVYVEDEAAFYMFKDTGGQNEWVKESSNVSLEGYTESGSAAGGNLVLRLGDYNASGNHTQILLLDAGQTIQVGEPGGASLLTDARNGTVEIDASTNLQLSSRIITAPELTISDIDLGIDSTLVTKEWVLDNSNESLLLASTNTTNTNALALHVGGMNDVDAVSNITLTIQDNATEDIPVGSTLTYSQINDGRIIVAYSGAASGDAGQTYKKGDVLTLWHKSLDNWVILNPPRALDSTTLGEPTGSDQVFNIVSLTQAAYDAGTPVATTLYNITDA